MKNQLYDNAFLKGLENAQDRRTSIKDATKTKLDTYNPSYDKYHLYDEAYLRNLEGAINLRTSVEDASNTNINSYNPSYGKGHLNALYNKEEVENKYKIPLISATKYFSAEQLYTNTNDNYYKNVILDYANAGGAINVGKGRPIDPVNIFNREPYSYNKASYKYDAHYESTGYITCETKGRSYTVRLASTPDNIQENTQVNTASGSAVGMSQDYNFFTGVGSRVVSFSFVVYADYLPSPYQDVVTYCRDLKQMNYPTYSSTFTNSPSVTFVYGGLSITGIPNINITFGSTIKKGKVDKATVSVSITETSKITGGRVLGYN